MEPATVVILVLLSLVLAVCLIGFWALWLEIGLLKAQVDAVAEHAREAEGRTFEMRMRGLR